MPRLPRLHLAGGCYHVVLRGNHRENIFSSADDRYVLNAIVAEAIEKYGARIHALCWMTNHLHGLIQVGTEPLGKGAGAGTEDPGGNWRNPHFWSTTRRMLVLKKFMLDEWLRLHSTSITHHDGEVV